MERKSLLQSFALDKDGRMRAVDEVSRGLACAGACPVCGESVVARQGEIRGWHFAHASGADCAGSAETALHRAAKQVLVDAGGITVPEMRASIDIRLPNEHFCRGTARQAGGWIDFESVEVERNYFGLRPDLLVTTGQRTLIIEIAVTHFLEPEKIHRIEELAVATLEIDLAGMERELWDWATLRELVVEADYNKQWIRSLEHERLRTQAKENALASSETPQPRIKGAPTAAPPPRTRYWVGGRIVDVTERAFGLAMWSPYDPILNQKLKALAWDLGGRWQRNFKNWLFPVEAKPYLEQRLIEWSDRPPVRLA